MSRTVTCDVCFESEDIDSFDISDKKIIEIYSKCPPDWMVSLNGRIDIMPKHDFLGRNVQISNICYDCLKESIIDLLVKRRKQEEDRDSID